MFTVHLQHLEIIVMGGLNILLTIFIFMYRPTLFSRRKDLEKLFSIIDAILHLYGRHSFKTNSLVKLYKKMDNDSKKTDNNSEETVHGQSFRLHLRHLVEIDLLSEHACGGKKTAARLYNIEDLKGLKLYRRMISLLLNPSSKSEEKLEKIENF